MQEGVAGLLRDKTRPSRIPALIQETVALVVARTHEPPPGETTHWTASLMAREAGISASSVHRIWRAHDLQPHRVRQFKLSNDPEFIDKLRDVVGLYVAPPAHAIVLSFDENSQIQGRDRSQPGLPLKKGRAGTMTHDGPRSNKAWQNRHAGLQEPPAPSPARPGSGCHLGTRSPGPVTRLGYPAGGRAGGAGWPGMGRTLCDLGSFHFALQWPWCHCIVKIPLSAPIPVPVPRRFPCHRPSYRPP